MSTYRLLSRLPANAVYGLALALIFGIALFVRTYFPYDNVFTGEWVRFQWYDSWYHMRLIENLVQHFPHRIYFDPYTYYPYGQDVFFAPFFDLLTGFVAWVVGLGSPSKAVIETVGAYMPAILGALVTIPVYFIGKELLNRRAGLIAAALVMILPGQFLLRSLLGFTDHHVAETLFSTVTMLFLILAVKTSRQRDISFGSLLARDWASLRKPLVYSVLAGLALGCYLLSWVGGTLLVFVIFVYAILQYLSDHLRGRSTDHLCIVIVPPILISMLMVVPFRGQLGLGGLHIASLAIAALTVAGLSLLSVIMLRRRMRRAYYPAALLVLGGLGFLLLYLAVPSLLDDILDKIGILNPGGAMGTVGEVRGLTLSMAWEEFTTGFYLALISLALIAYLVLKRGDADKTLLLVWSLIMLVATIGQNRFAYYFAVNAALLTGYITWRALALLGSRLSAEAARGSAGEKGQKELAYADKAKGSRKARRKKPRPRRIDTRTRILGHPGTRYAFAAIAAVILFFLAFYPNLGPAVDAASQPVFPRQDWHDALVWLGNSTNSQDPFGDADFYYQLYERPASGEQDPGEGEDGSRPVYDYPESAYGVMSWWDHGHWITYIAHRIPNANPHQSGSWAAAAYFLSQDESSANEMLDYRGSRYVIVDTRTALHEIDREAGIYGNFFAMVQWAGEDPRRFYEPYFVRDEQGRLQPILLYYPEYYQCMSSRLYIFAGAKVVPHSTWVIAYTEKTDLKGRKYREITEQVNFSTYAEAEAYLQTHDSPNYRIVGQSPFVSPVPLERLEHYRLVYKSPTQVASIGDWTVSEVEIFEYTP